MNNKAVQERLCTKPKDNPVEALQFAVSFEKGTKRQASYGECKLEIKSEPIRLCAISNPGKICFRFGAHTFTLQHIPKCKARK